MVSLSRKRWRILPPNGESNRQKPLGSTPQLLRT